MYRFTLFVLVLALLAGCGGSSSAPVATTASPAPARTAGGYGAAEVSVSSAMEGSAPARSYEPEPDPSTRPGLATQWGEARVSRVSTAPFTRAAASPAAIAALHYNDASGAAAQAALRSGGFTGPHLGIGAADQVAVSLVDQYGRALPAYSADGRVYVVGAPGQRYSIRITNRSPYRFEAVVSVDGLDVIDGREASFAKRGYIVRPGDTTVIDGFRTSDARVATFRFGAVGSSYAARSTGSARNVGVIGVALFAEAGVSVDLFEEAIRRENADPFPGRYAAPPPGTLAY